jgi:hypothetical protein
MTTMTQTAPPRTALPLADDRAATVRGLLGRLRPEPGDVLLFHGPEKWRGRLISWFTRSRFYHVGIYAGNGHVIEARIPRVVRRDLTDLDGCRFVVLRAPSAEAGRRALAWAEARVGEPYDLWGVAAAALARVSPRRVAPLLCRLCRAGRHVCGGFVARAFSEGAGVPLLPAARVSDALLVPADFAVLAEGEERAPATHAAALWKGAAACR